MRGWLKASFILLSALALLAGAAPALANKKAEPPPELVVPRVERPPQLEEFVTMKPAPEWEGKLAKVTEFTQYRPSDGKPSTERTEAYVGYDQQNLYFIFIAFDSEPQKLRARLVNREQFVDAGANMMDDGVSISIDTFNDQRRGYVFQINPYGVQWDALYSDSRGFDSSFDTVWHSRGQITPEGFVVWVAIPFKSLRFPDTPEQTWGILLNRDIPRKSEITFWPHHSQDNTGYINQAAPMRGLRDISPGRNIQLTPYGSLRSFRAVDRRDPAAPRFRGEDAEFDGGLDAKLVLKDSLVLDVTVNPDFSQVESDEPQVTVNERFEVFFPEKRPFFLENSSYFTTPINLVFTRRIADPLVGARVTGKLGRWAMGAMVVDDESPGKRVTPGSPLEDRRAWFGIVRVNRDIFKQSTLGVIFTNRQFHCGASCTSRDAYNRVGGADARLQFSRQWAVNLQAITSATQFLNGTRIAGPAYEATINRRGRKFNMSARYSDRSPGFFTETGFVTRPDIRDFSTNFRYSWRPEGKRFIAWGPGIMSGATWDHAGTRLNWIVSPSVNFEFRGYTNFSFFYAIENELLRPGDAPNVASTLDFHRITRGASFSTQALRFLTVSGSTRFGQRIHIDPPGLAPPTLEDRWSGDLGFTLRPTRQLRVDNTYIFFRLTRRADDSGIFSNHIIRSKWNYQFTREISARLIFQYDALLANGLHTSLPTRKNFNADFLFTWLVHPGTALYLGYNSNLQNQDILPCAPPATCSTQLVRTKYFRNDARGLFVKFSYLFRF
jgi:hypothetical protein